MIHYQSNDYQMKLSLWTASYIIVQSTKFDDHLNNETYSISDLSFVTTGDSTSTKQFRTESFIEKVTCSSTEVKTLHKEKNT